MRFVNVYPRLLAFCFAILAALFNLNTYANTGPEWLNGAGYAHKSIPTTKWVCQDTGELSGSYEGCGTGDGDYPSCTDDSPFSYGYETVGWELNNAGTTAQYIREYNKCSGQNVSRIATNTANQTTVQELGCEPTDVNFGSWCATKYEVIAEDSCEPGNFAPPPKNMNEFGFACQIQSDGSMCLIDQNGFVHDEKTALALDGSGERGSNGVTDCYLPATDPGYLPRQAPFDYPENDPNLGNGTAENCTEFYNGLACLADPSVMCSGLKCQTGCGTVDVGDGEKFMCFTSDNDGDGLPDVNDPDLDNDGISNWDDWDDDNDGQDDPISLSDSNYVGGYNSPNGSLLGGGTSGLSGQQADDLINMAGITANATQDLNDNLTIQMNGLGERVTGVKSSIESQTSQLGGILNDIKTNTSNSGDSSAIVEAVEDLDEKEDGSTFNKTASGSFDLAGAQAELDQAQLDYVAAIEIVKQEIENSIALNTAIGTKTLSYCFDLDYMNSSKQTCLTEYEDELQIVADMMIFIFGVTAIFIVMGRRNA